ncbi:MAG: undecaprenyl/decaprenyl-phosphate alpha-N-acetylglucosaminyl 1-phosphate transferase [Nitrospiraceae bacterium]|nr:MAG: undecaprenyl/decaprenyl-phosphate alpha-N-acetylglucosaminyl 1-phosphate transferase [Nitrospiraceae bacterium]
MLLYLLTFILALSLALYGVPLARRAALQFNIVDRPDGRLKHQPAPVPYFGGLAVYLAFLISLALTFEFRQDVLGLVLGGTLMVMVGLIDDFGVLQPWPKLIGQLIAVLVLIRSGIRIEIAAFPEWLDLLLTVVWMIGIINAINIIDVMDGLAGGVSVVACFWLFVVAVLNQDAMVAVMLAALAGSLVGFLRYNFHPASIYLGDAGSLFVGLMLGALAMIGKYTVVHPVSVLAPVLILGVPIFDTLFVMYIRWLRRIPIFLGSPDHFALRLRRRSLSVPRVSAVTYAAAFVLGGVGVLSMFVSFGVALGLFTGALGLAVVAALWLKRADMSAPADGARVPGPAAESSRRNP